MMQRARRHSTPAASQNDDVFSAHEETPPVDQNPSEGIQKRARRRSSIKIEADFAESESRLSRRRTSVTSPSTIAATALLSPTEPSTSLLNTNMSPSVSPQKSQEALQMDVVEASPASTSKTKTMICNFCLQPEGDALLGPMQKQARTAAHVNCLRWSSLVTKKTSRFENIRTAITLAQTTMCTLCKNPGASVYCEHSDCKSVYHFKCSIKARCLRVSGFHMFCSIHRKLLENNSLPVTILRDIFGVKHEKDHSGKTNGNGTVNGVVEDDDFLRKALEDMLSCEECHESVSTSEKGPLLSCVECGVRRHRGCVAAEAIPIPATYGQEKLKQLHDAHVALTEQQYPWRCGPCQRCQVCLGTEEEAEMLTCDACDENYHTFCLNPPLTALPQNGWRCPKCVYCLSCKRRVPAIGEDLPWQLDYTSCDECYQWRNKGYICPVCFLTYHEIVDDPMVQCSKCEIWVHAACDDINEDQFKLLQTDDSIPYLCPPCRKSTNVSNVRLKLSLPSIIHQSSLPSLEDEVKVSRARPSRRRHRHQAIQVEPRRKSNVASGEIKVVLKSSKSPRRPAARKRNLLIDLDADDDIEKEQEQEQEEEEEEEEQQEEREDVDITEELLIVASPEQQIDSLEECKVKQNKRKKIEELPVPPPTLLVLPPSEPQLEQEVFEGPSTSSVALIIAKNTYPVAAEICSQCQSSGGIDPSVKFSSRLEDPEQLISCFTCGESFHLFCAFPPDGSAFATKDLSRGVWNCMNCLVCDQCNESYPENTLLVCDSCERGFHTACLEPPLENVPTGAWLCMDCTICLQCGSTAAMVGIDGWNADFNLCSTCTSNTDNLQCCVCLAPIQLQLNVPWVACATCPNQVHGVCDGVDGSMCDFLSDANAYKCPVCRAITAAAAMDVDITAESGDAQTTTITTLQFTKPMVIAQGEDEIDTFIHDLDASQQQQPSTQATHHYYHHENAASLSITNGTYDLSTPVDPSSLRSCVLCNLREENPFKVNPGRFFIASNTALVHARCALWSAKVTESNNILTDVDNAISQGKDITCLHCHANGATLSCRDATCSKSYHFHCGVEVGIAFYENLSVLCPVHIASNQIGSSLDDHANTRVSPRVALDRAYRCSLPNNYSFNSTMDWIRYGAITITNIGDAKTVLAIGDDGHLLVGLGYEAQRLFWRVPDLDKLEQQSNPIFPTKENRVVYKCSVYEENQVFVYRISWDDENTLKRHTVTASTPNDAVKLLFDRLQRTRLKNQLLGEHFFGLSIPAVQQAIRKSLTTLKLPPLGPAMNPSGCARCETFDRSARTTRFAFLSHGLSTDVSNRLNGVLDTDLPSGMKYRQLRRMAKRRLRVLKSPIQGWGLFATEDIERGDMCIEYMGEVIGAKVADKREKIYERKGIGCYMFRLDENRIVDATFAGNAARFINHSCDPHCYSRIAVYDGEPRIIIFAKNRIEAGTELTYDYQMPIEDVKLPCRCGASNCRGSMN